MEDGQSHPPILHSYWERVLLEEYKVMGTQNSCTVNTKDTRTIPCFLVHIHKHPPGLCIISQRDTLSTLDSCLEKICYLIIWMVKNLVESSLPTFPNLNTIGIMGPFGAGKVILELGVIDKSIYFHPYEAPTSYDCISLS